MASSPQPKSQPQRHAIALSVFVLSALLCVGCSGGGNGFTGGGGVTPTPTPTPTPVPTPTPPLPPSSIEVTVGNAKVPPLGIYQYQVLLTEPKPIGNSSSRPTLPTSSTGPVRGVAVNDVSGMAAGIAVINAAGAVSVKLTSGSPTVTLGTDNTYPLFTMTMPVNATATPGQVFPATLDSASFFDGAGQSYTILANTPGNLTIGGALDQSITDVVPGGGLLPDRSTIKVLGIGFTANTRITIEGTTVLFVPGETTFVSANEIDVKICNGVVDPLAVTCPNNGGTFQLDGERVRAINRDTNAIVEYFSYARTDDESGASGTTLATQVHAMFSRQTYGTAAIPYVSDATHFTGFGLQNTSGTDATFRVELLDSGGNVLPNSTVVSVRAGKRIVRDIHDWIPVISGTPATVRVTVVSGPAKLQMLGMVGDLAAGTVTPVVVTGQ